MNDEPFPSLTEAANKLEVEHKSRVKDGIVYTDATHAAADFSATLLRSRESDRRNRRTLNLVMATVIVAVVVGFLINAVQH